MTAMYFSVGIQRNRVDRLALSSGGGVTVSKVIDMSSSKYSLLSWRSILSCVHMQTYIGKSRRYINAGQSVEIVLECIYKILLITNILQSTCTYE
jgi:hypothetical protein